MHTAKLIEKAIAGQTERLISYDLKKPSVIAVNDGYLEVSTNASGGKTIKRVNVN